MQIPMMNFDLGRTVNYSQWKAIDRTLLSSFG